MDECSSAAEIGRPSSSERHPLLAKSPARNPNLPINPEMQNNPELPQIPAAAGNNDNPMNGANNSDDSSGEERDTNSPPSNCSICLGTCRNKCFSDSCLHQFCFKCLLQWSKVKPECPLCKQNFRTIIHNVRSIDQFDEYVVQPEPSNALQTTGYRERRSSHERETERERDRERERRRGRGRTRMYAHRFDVFVVDLPRFRNEFSATLPMLSDPLNIVLRERYQSRQFPDSVIASGEIAVLWRSYIYEARLYSLPVVDLNGRNRECSAAFYRSNPSQVHRLAPWVNRDLVCLLRTSHHHVPFVVHTVMSLLTVYNINSVEFRKQCIPFFGGRAFHFIHELYNFARSPYDMIGYDRQARYAPFEEITISSSSTSSASEYEEEILNRVCSIYPFSESGIALRSEMERARRNNSNGGPSGQLRAIESSEPVPGPSGFMNLSRSLELEASSGRRALPGRPASPRTPESSGIPVSPGRLVSPGTPVSQGRPVSSGTPVLPGTSQSSPASTVIASPPGPKISLSSESSNDCEFVLELKPPHLRTPELVSLNSETDSDVVFVNEVKTETRSWESPKPQTTFRSSSAANQANNNQPSTSTDYGSYNRGERRSARTRYSAEPVRYTFDNRRVPKTTSNTSSGDETDYDADSDPFSFRSRSSSDSSDPLWSNSTASSRKRVKRKYSKKQKPGKRGAPRKRKK